LTAEAACLRARYRYRDREGAGFSHLQTTVEPLREQNPLGRRPWPPPQRILIFPNGATRADAFGDNRIYHQKSEKLTPSAMMSGAVAHKQSLDQAHQARQQQIERLRYQASWAQRQFARVDPDNRLVAAELEARWEAALRELKQAEDAAAQASQVIVVPFALTAEMKVAFTAMAATPRSSPSTRRKAARWFSTAGCRMRSGATATAPSVRQQSV
jgi:hypothetical protein